MELGVFESPGREWDEFAFQHTDLIFYQSIWSEVLKRGLDGQPLYFYLSEGGKIVAGLPGVLLHFKIFNILYASIPYGHLIGEKSYYSIFLELLDKEFRKRGIDQVRLTESPFLESYPPASFEPIAAKCTLVDLKQYDKQNVWEGYRGEVRRAVRKAQKHGLSIRAATRRNEMEIFYRLYRSSMERNRAVAKYPRRWFDSLFEILILQKRADVLFAVKDGHYAAGVVLVHSGTSIHYLHNGSSDVYLESRPNDLIIDHIIQQGVEEEKSTLDFMGSDSSDLPLLRFKEKWGGHSVDLHTYVKDYRPFRSKVWEWGRAAMNSSLGGWAMRRFRGWNRDRAE